MAKEKVVKDLGFGVFRCHPCNKPFALEDVEGSRAVCPSCMKKIVKKREERKAAKKG